MHRCGGLRSFHRSPRFGKLFVTKTKAARNDSEIPALIENQRCASFHVIGQHKRGAVVLRQKWSRGQVASLLTACYANVDCGLPLPPAVALVLAFLGNLAKLSR
jgi:hypothetical protein